MFIFMGAKRPDPTLGHLGAPLHIPSHNPLTIKPLASPLYRMTQNGSVLVQNCTS